MKYKSISLPILFLISTTALAAEWNGGGVIKTMYIYPTYSVIVQGKVTSGTAGCVNDGAWSFEWSQFDTISQNRIQSMLLTAYASKTPVNVAVETTGCGPENKKKFNGQINFY